MPHVIYYIYIYIRFGFPLSHPQCIRVYSCQRSTFKQYIFLYHYRNSIHRTPFLPYFFFNFDTVLLEIKPRMAMYPVDANLSNSSINKIFLKKSSAFIINAKTFYTDGSKLDSDVPSGASVYSPDFNVNIMHRLPAESSVFSAEAWAINLAIHAVINYNCTKAVIFSDSKSVLNALASLLSSNKNYLIHYVRKSWLNCIRKGTELHIFWIPVHKGIQGNEIADSLAKKALTHGFKPNFKIPYSNLFSEIKESLNKSFTSYLNDTAQLKGVIHASLYQNVNSRFPWYYDKPLNRKIILIIRIRSNHYNFNYSLHRKNMVPSAACFCGDPKQDINHIIFFCPNTTPKSRHLRSYLIEHFPFHVIDIFLILKDPKLIRLMLSYLRSNNIII